MAKVVIAHISDFHVGSYYFSESLIKQTIGELNRVKPDIVVVGGDLTNMGLWPEAPRFDILVSSGVNMVLSGHKHVPHIWQIEDILVVNAGTTSCLRLRGKSKPCYNIIEIEGGKAKVFQKQPGGAKKRVV